MKHLSSEYHNKCNNAYQIKIEGIQQSYQEFTER